MNNGNRNNLISSNLKRNEFNENFTSPNLNKKLDITKNYIDFIDLDDFSQNSIQDENNNDNVNEKLIKVKDEYIEYLQSQLNEYNTNAIKLESKLRDLQKKYKNLLNEKNNIK